MEKTEGKIRYGLIGIGAQGGSYARFLTNAPAPFPGLSLIHISEPTRP